MKTHLRDKLLKPFSMRDHPKHSAPVLSLYNILNEKSFLSVYQELTQKHISLNIYDYLLVTCISEMKARDIPQQLELFQGQQCNVYMSHLR